MISFQRFDKINLPDKTIAVVVNKYIVYALASL